MPEFKLPYGADFSPDKINIAEVVQMASECEKKDTSVFLEKLDDKYFKNSNMASNCKNSMVAYGILESGGGIALSTFGYGLKKLSSEAEMYDAMARHILKYLNGLMYIEAIRTIRMSGEKPSLEKMAITLNLLGCNPQVSTTNKAVSTMKKWLEKAGVLNGWKIKEKKLTELTGIENERIEVLKNLKPEQVFFLRTLCSVDSDKMQDSAKIRNLAVSSFNTSFPGKNFSAKIIKPLEEKGLIERELETSTHGGNAPKVKIVDSVKKEILAPILGQIQILAGNEVVQYCQKSLHQLRNEMDSENIHIKGLALEAFAIRVMQIINLDFAGTRVKGNETAGAEVDVIFDTTRLSYSKW